MTDRERREGPGNTKDNVQDDLDEATKRRNKDATTDAVDEEEAAGGPGGTKGNVADDQEKTQRS